MHQGGFHERNDMFSQFWQEGGKRVGVGAAEPGGEIGKCRNNYSERPVGGRRASGGWDTQHVVTMLIGWIVRDGVMG